MNKKSRTFSLSEQLYQEFIEYCNKNQLNRSAVVTNLIEKFLNEHNVNQAQKTE